MKGQKEAVVEAVKRYIPNFTLYRDVALESLTSAQLECIKNDIGNGISSGQILYNKDNKNQHEVYSYARSMVMNHLKKAKELNGNKTNGNITSVNKSATINSEILPDDLKSFVKTLVE